MKFKFWAAIALAATLFSCDDTTTGIGDFVSDNDKISAFADSYTVSSRTVLLDSVYSRTLCYAGRLQVEGQSVLDASKVRHWKLT